MDTFLEICSKIVIKISDFFQSRRVQKGLLFSANNLKGRRAELHVFNVIIIFNHFFDDKIVLIITKKFLGILNLDGFSLGVKGIVTLGILLVVFQNEFFQIL